VSSDQAKEPYGFTPDGRTFLYSVVRAATLQDIWRVEVDGHEPAVVLQTPFIDARPRISPDGRWLAYYSSESGRPEIFVTSFPNRQGKWQVSTAGGNFPRWRRDGREIFYLAPDNSLMAVDVNSTGPTLEVGSARRLFELRARQFPVAGQSGYAYDVSPDGHRILVNALLEEANEVPITVVANWPTLLEPD